MKVTKTDNQDLILKNKIELFFKNSMANKKNTGVCVVKDIMSVVTDKWSTLKKLENHEVITRKVFAEVPPRVEYSLTPFGKELTTKAVDLNAWFLNFESE